MEEVKRRSKCWKSHKLGHFARDCRASGPASSSSQGGGKEHAAGTVAYEGQPAGIPEHFICSAGVWSPDHDDEHAVCLVSSPGFAVLDSGCGKTIVGEQTLQDFLAIWKAYELEPPKEILEQNAFRYGNGEREISQRVIEMPVTLANRRGIVRAAVVKGSAPLLLSRAALKTLKANIDFENDQLTLFGTKVPLLVNDAGQYTVNVSKFNPVDRSTSPMTTAPAAPCADPSHDDEPETAEPGVQTSTCESVQINRKRDKVKDYWEVRPKDRVVIRHHLKPRRARFTPCHTQCPIDVEDLMPSRCTHVQLDHQPDVLQFCDQWTNPVDAHHVQSQGTWKGRTVFAIHPSVDLSRFETHAEQEVCLTQWTPKQHRQLMSQIRQGETSNSDQKLHVVEVFSPPRFALECEKLGYACVSADLCTGWDFRKPADRQLMRDIVAKRKPDLLMLCPPCTWAGGWFHLNRTHMTAEQVQEKTLLTRLFINFCCQLIQIQLKNGGRVVFEHPRDSVAWNILTQRFPRLLTVEVDMRSYGLAIPGGHLIRKPTRLLVSHADMQGLGKKCPGSENPKHRIHQPIAGYVSGIGRVSTHAGKYPAFVKAVLASVKELPDTPVLVCDVAVEVECLAASRVAELNEADGEALKRSLTKLHSNLGHPPNQQLVRVLKHGGAAIQMARTFSCEQCASQVVPRAALPAQTHRTTEFNALVGIDVKYLTGWKANQRIPALNIVDYASSLQIMVPLFQKENSTLIREAFMERWVSWAGMPAEVVCDPAKPNVTDALTKPLEERGAAFKMTAADAHWQLGKTEVHGGWFDKILSKVITEQTPKDQTEWIACVHAAHCKNQLIQVYGMTPSQFVFGRNPRIPENLLDEPLEVVPATSALYQDAVAKQVSVRQSARRAVLELQDSKALRLALSARPRNTVPVAPGQYVAYWRTQKWVQGTLDKQGKWHGPAVVLGHVGRNVVIIHKRQIFRCAPEQCRPATESEAQLAQTPDLGLAGIKNLIEKGAIDSKQYVDLVPEEYPTEQDSFMPRPVPMDTSNPVVADRESSGPQSLSDAVQRSSNEIDRVVTVPDEALPEGNPSNATTTDTAVQDGSPSDGPNPEAKSSKDSETYGPIRRRTTGKQGPMALYRPGRMTEEDFSEMMSEVVPDLINRLLDDSAQSSSSSSGIKRSAEDGQPEGASEAKTSRTKSPSRESPGDEELLVENEGVTFACDEIAILSVQHETLPVENLTKDEKIELANRWKDGEAVESLVASYIQKKMAKEIRCTGNPPELQRKVDEAKLLEWNTITAKHAARLVLGPEAQHVHNRLSHRIMGSRYVMTIKQEDDAPERVKARWCLQGHLDPDLSSKAVHGDLQSPTLSQVARHMIFQLIASNKWRLKLGDIKGAFLSAGDLPEKYRPLYARLPSGGIPGVPDDALIEVVGHVYGLNDSPSAWFKKLSSVLIEAGFEKSRYDSCLFYMRDKGELTGIYGVHVDDCATGGHGTKYEQALKEVQSKFEFRKWRDGQQGGDFCGASYIQDPYTLEVLRASSFKS